MRSLWSVEGNTTLTRSTESRAKRRFLGESRRLHLEKRFDRRLRRLAVECLEDRRLLSIEPWPVPLDAVDPPLEVIYDSPLPSEDESDKAACEYKDAFSVSTAVDENDGDYSPGDLSLREALALAAELPGNDVIEFDSSLVGGAITLDATLGQV